MGRSTGEVNNLETKQKSPMPLTILLSNSYWMAESDTPDFKVKRE